ncbi:TonB family protein [Hymenobacter sp.]|uniref:TonB family protein n=1 Tax=Hymenobacter sp. TaxID=1898978 RepID=UPI002D7F5A43|nr:TonB family protein [Hymenobacter sp.]
MRFPAECLRAQMEGRVFVAFTITPAGEARQVAVVKGLYEPFDAAAVQAVRQLPCFRPRPARQGNVRYVVGVDFRAAAKYTVQ